MIGTNSSNPIRRYGLARRDTSLRSARNKSIFTHSSAYPGGTTMPLPNVASGQTLQCTARSKRHKRRCLNPAAYGMPVCRFHGARRPETIKRGSDHPQFIYGRETQQRRQARQEAAIRLRDLEELMHLFQFTTAKRTPGRKPGSQFKAAPSCTGDKN